MFFHSFTDNSHAKWLAFHHVPWKQCPKSNQNIPNHCTTCMLGNFHMLELYSTNQIPVTLIRLCSIMCHFLVNNQHLITFSNHIVQPHWKIFTKCCWQYIFHTILLCFEFFYEWNWLLASLTSIQSRYFLVTNLYFITCFTHRGQSPDSQQPTKEPSLKHYSFLFFNVSSLIWDDSISLARVYWRQQGFSLLFIVKWGGIIFLRQPTVDE